MTSKKLLALSAVLGVSGLIIFNVGLNRVDEAGAASYLFVGVGALLMMTFLVSLNQFLNARRQESGAASRNSIEFQASQLARSGAFGDGLISGAFVILMLVIAPGEIPAVWGFLGLLVPVVTFWIRYRRALHS